MVAEETAGDPMSFDKWCRKSTYTLSEGLKNEGIDICPNSVGKLLKGRNYRLRSNRKNIAQTQHPDRDQQFRIISNTRKRFEDLGQPTISVDSKKRECVGNFKNPGKTWLKNVINVFVHDFLTLAVGIANPYGIYEVLTNLGMVIVGTSRNTAEFAVDSIETWLAMHGWDRYKKIKELLILCDGGGSNSARCRLWKYCLYHKIAKVHGITIRVCHYPTGASKWNPVEHRLFSHITSNWQGRPLKSYEMILGCIKSTKTKQGLLVDAQLNQKKYQKGVKISDSQMKQIKLRHEESLPLWNYTIG